MAVETDLIWQSIRQEVSTAAAEEPLLASFLHMTVLRHSSFQDVLAFHLSSKLICHVMDGRALLELFQETYQSYPELVDIARADIRAHYESDPACGNYSTPFLFFKGFHAIQCYRITHCLWQQGRKTLALFLQNRISEMSGVDIHPAAKIGHGIMFDHATGIVVGETSVIENDVIPFNIKRVYYLYDVPSGAERGGHSHIEQQEFLVALSGSFDVVMTDATNKMKVTLNKPNQGLLIPTGIWRELENFSSGSVCLVIASGVFKEADYIRDFEHF